MPEIRTRLLDGIDRVARGTALALGVPEDRLPTVTRSRDRDDAADDQRSRDRARASATRSPRRWARDRLIEHAAAGMGAEDFAYFVTPESGVKGVYFSVGGTPRGRARDRAGPPFAPVPDRSPSRR